MNLKLALRVSGFAYLLIFITGFYANFSVLETMVMPSDPETTVKNFMQYHTQVGQGILAFVAMLAFDMILVFTLFYVTKKVSRKMSAIASGFRLLHAIGFGMALMYLVEVYQITGHTSGMEMYTLQNSVITLLQRFDKIWTIGLLLFGVHLAFLGYLSFKSDLVPKSLGYLLCLAAIGYLVSCTAQLLMPNYTDYEQGFELLVMVFGVVGELAFTIWLLIKGFGRNPLKTIDSL
tara:strand:- start:5843 stop:6544 length:702 start_codon:yes stop_codon:yes gene_type:complete